MPIRQDVSARFLKAPQAVCTTRRPRRTRADFRFCDFQGNFRDDRRRHSVLFVALHLFNRFVDSFAVINAVAFVLFAAGGEFRLDVAGKDCRNFYVERFKFDTKRLGKRRHRRFRAGIKRLKRQRQRRARAGHIDYRAAVVFAHNGDNRLRREQRAEVIDVKIFRTALSSVSSTAPEMPNPALLTRTSIRPARFTTSPIESNTFSRSDTSVFMLSMPSAGVLDKLNTRYPFSESFLQWHSRFLGMRP